MNINIVKVQRLLQLLGQQLTTDGIWGAISEAALDAEIAKRDIKSTFDNLVQATLGFWSNIRWFNRSEMRCPCGKCNGYPVEPSEKLMRLADAVREEIGVPMTISSGVRCSQHNAEVGGVYNSRHLYGRAMDVRAKGMTASALLAKVKAHPEVAYAYAIDDTYIHMDVID